MSRYESMSREELLRALDMFAKNWLAHDGCWFLAAEETLGMKTALDLDARAWGRFAAIEADRLRKVFDIPAGGGLEALEKALGLRMYALLDEQEIVLRKEEGRLELTMRSCRVQDARRRKGLSDFPCRDVGEVEFRTFAETIDPRIRTDCLGCPPEPAEGGFCRWAFTIAPGRQTPG